MKVITRFAPSPTGMLHIGGARTALFNYLFARHHGGDFKLRIEDTDAKRSTPEATQAILDGMQWLGLSHDGEVIFQSHRYARHREVAEELVKLGQAYYCYTTAEELKAQREAAEAKGEQFKYDRKWRTPSPSPLAGEGRGEGASAQSTHAAPPPHPTSPAGGEELTPPPGVKPSIRIKAPLTGEVIVKDAVQGDVRFGADVLDDFVILRADGTPTYMHAVVVDDHDMGITHIIRGDDHLNNAGRQMVIYQAMGWTVPQFAHIPLIHDAGGAKLSKRKGAASTMEYAEMGYLPETMRNYLARLGWAHGDDEIFTDAQAIEWFSLEHIGQSPSRLDFAKLNHVNAHYLRQHTGTELAAMLGVDAAFAAAIESVKEKASTLVELKEQVKFYLTAPTSYDDKARDVLAKGRDNLALLIPALEALGEWTDTAIKAAVTQVAEQSGQKLGALMPPLRAAIVGAMSGPDIPVAMAVLGQPESLKRLKTAAQG